MKDTNQNAISHGAALIGGKDTFPTNIKQRSLD